MKVAVVACVLVARSLVLEAKPLQLQWISGKVLDSSYEGVGDFWQDCSKPGDVARIDKVKITPDYPVKDKPITLDATFTILNETVTGGQISVTLKIDGIPFIKRDFDLCTEAALAGLDCPIKAGQHMISTTQTIPDVSPKGNYSTNVVANDQNMKEIGCVTANFKL